jgi:hypothetical protein
MKSSVLGELKQDSNIEEWYYSEPVKVPLLENQKLKFVVEVAEGEEVPADADEAIRAFLHLKAQDKNSITPYLYEYYKSLVVAVDEEERELTIDAAEDVWRYVEFEEIHVARRLWGDQKIYIKIEGECHWDEEHGLQIVMRSGNELCRVSGQDGALTNTDAFASCIDESVILYDA